MPLNYREAKQEELERIAEQLQKTASQLLTVVAELRADGLPGVWVPWTRKDLESLGRVGIFGTDAQRALQELRFDLQTHGQSRRKLNKKKSAYNAKLRERKRKEGESSKETKE